MTPGERVTVGAVVVREQEGVLILRLDDGFAGAEVSADKAKVTPL